MKHLLFEGPLDGTVIEDDSLGFPGFITARVGASDGIRGSTYMFVTDHDGHLSTEDHRVYVFLPVSGTRVPAPEALNRDFQPMALKEGVPVE